MAYFFLFCSLQFTYFFQVISREDICSKDDASILDNDNKGLRQDLRIFEGTKLWIERKQEPGFFLLFIFHLLPGQLLLCINFCIYYCPY